MKAILMAAALAGLCAAAISSESRAQPPEEPTLATLERQVEARIDARLRVQLAKLVAGERAAQRTASLSLPRPSDAW